MKMSVNGASTIVRQVSCVICGATCCTLSYNDYWLPLEAQMIVKRFLPHLQNEHEHHVNDCWPSIMINPSVMWRLLFKYIIFTVIICYKAQEYLVVAL